MASLSSSHGHPSLGWQKRCTMRGWPCLCPLHHHQDNHQLRHQSWIVAASMQLVLMASNSRHYGSTGARPLLQVWRAVGERSHAITVQLHVMEELLEFFSSPSTLSIASKCSSIASCTSVQSAEPLNPLRSVLV